MTPQGLLEKLATSLDNATLFYLEGLEFGEIPSWQDKAVGLFEDISDSIADVPEATIATTLWHRDRLGPRVFEQHLTEAVSSVGRVSFPNSAAEFLDLLNLGFEHVGP